MTQHLPLGLIGDIGVNGDFASGEHAKKAVRDAMQTMKGYLRMCFISCTHPFFRNFPFDHLGVAEKS